MIKATIKEKTPIDDAGAQYIPDTTEEEKVEPQWVKNLSPRQYELNKTWQGRWQNEPSFARIFLDLEQRIYELEQQLLDKGTK